MYGTLKFIAAAALLLCTLGGASVLAEEKGPNDPMTSVYLNYSGPASVAYYNECTVEKSVPATYFAVCGFNAGYFGIQELGNGKKVVIFSIWDQHQGNDRNAVPDDVRVKAIDAGENVVVSRFGGEGTGGKSMFDYDWNVGQTCRFLVTVKADGDRAAYTGYFYLHEVKQWKRLVTFSTISKGKQIHGYYSFIEDFRRNRETAKQARVACFGNEWIQTADGKWMPMLEAHFGSDGNKSNNYDAGLLEGSFILATGGDTQNTHTKMNGKIVRPAAPPPDDLETITRDAIKTLAPLPAPTPAPTPKQ